jgi:hypothetical protein
VFPSQCFQHCTVHQKSINKLGSWNISRYARCVSIESLLKIMIVSFITLYYLFSFYLFIFLFLSFSLFLPPLSSIFITSKFSSIVSFLLYPFSLFSTLLLCIMFLICVLCVFSHFLSFSLDSLRLGLYNGTAKLVVANQIAARWRSLRFYICFCSYCPDRE